MPNWTKEQSDAINKDGTNIIVSAGAGSGKTAVLSERVLRKLKEGVNVNELLILTFTKAAAKEMKERIRKKIKKEPSLSSQLELIDSAYTTTFDSYSLSVLKKYHYLLNLPKNIGITDSTLVQIKKEEILDNIFEELYEEKNEKFEEFISQYPIFEYRILDTKDITIQERVRTICQEECERYDSTWACPPAVGTLQECEKK